MKDEGIARITELMVSISFSQRLTWKEKKQINKLDKRNHVSKASPKRLCELIPLNFST